MSNSPSANEPNSATEPVPLSPEFVEDLRIVFAKHNWPGHPVGFVAPVAAAALDDDDDGCDPGPDICPYGSQPQQVPVRCPDGTIILRNVCP